MESISGAVSPLHIHAIDDSLDVLDLFRSLFAIEGCEGTTQAHQIRRLDAVIAAQPGVIILDHVRNDEAGWSVPQSGRTNAQTTFFLIVRCATAVQEMANQSAQLDAMTIPVIRKPFPLISLLPAVQSRVAMNGIAWSPLAITLSAD